MERKWQTCFYCIYWYIWTAENIRPVADQIFLKHICAVISADALLFPTNHYIISVSACMWNIATFSLWGQCIEMFVLNVDLTISSIHHKHHTASHNSQHTLRLYSRRRKFILSTVFRESQFSNPTQWMSIYCEIRL